MQDFFKRKRMDVILGVLYGGGLLLIGTAATVYWSNGSKTLSLWFLIGGTVWVILTAGFQTQLAIWESERDVKHDGAASIVVARILSDPVMDNPVTQKLVGWGISVEWENTGATKAKNFEAWFAMRRFQPDISPDFDCSAGKSTEGVPIEVAAGKIQNSGIGRFPLAEFEAAQRGDGQIYIWGMATYNDNFRGTPVHHTAFLARVVIEGNIHAPGVPFSYQHHLKKCNYAD